MKYTRLHTNAFLAMSLQTLLTAGLIAALFFLVTERVEAKGAKDIITGALLPVIAMSIKQMGDIAKEFAAMRED